MVVVSISMRRFRHAPAKPSSCARSSTQPVARLVTVSVRSPPPTARHAPAAPHGRFDDHDVTRPPEQRPHRPREIGLRLERDDTAAQRHAASNVVPDDSAPMSKPGRPDERTPHRGGAAALAETESRDR